MSAHTPGPWRMESADFPGCILSATNQRVATCHRVEAESLSFRAANEARDANARLIAAAPELLAALKELVAVADLLALKAPASTADRCRAAIAKAEGVK